MQKYIGLNVFKLICDRFKEYNLLFEGFDNILYIKQLDVIHKIIVEMYDDFGKVGIGAVLIKDVDLNVELLGLINYKNTHTDIITMYATNGKDASKCDVSISCAILFCDKFDIEAFARYYSAFVSYGQDNIKEIQSKFGGLTVKEHFKSKGMI